MNFHQFIKIIHLIDGYSVKNEYIIDKKKKLIAIVENYPAILNDSIFNGFKLINFNGKNIASVSLKKFSDDIQYKNKQYINHTTYYKNGTIKSFTFTDEINFEYENLKYDVNGFRYFTEFLNKNEYYKVERKKKGKILFIEKKEKNEYHKIKMINGKEVYRKKIE
jgi:hypothetical protein